MADIFNIAGRIHSTSQEEVVTTTDEILDESQGKKQSEVNSEVGEELALHTNRLNALTGQNYVTVVATQSTTAADIPTLINATGDGEQVDTLYRVGFWDGSAYVADKYTEYAWNGTAYVILDVKSSIGEVFDISQYNAVGGTLTPYADLEAALGVDGANVPSSVRRGGMSVKFIQGTVQSSGNQYVQYRLMATSFAISESSWQGVDTSPIDSSKNLIESGGIKKFIDGNIIYSNNNLTISTGNTYVRFTLTSELSTNRSCVVKIYGVSGTLSVSSYSWNSIISNFSFIDGENFFILLPQSSQRFEIRIPEAAVEDIHISISIVGDSTRAEANLLSKENFIKPVINVNRENGKTDAYTSEGMARLGIGYQYRLNPKGLIIEYLLADGWHTERCIVDEFTNASSGWENLDIKGLAKDSDVVKNTANQGMTDTQKQNSLNNLGIGDIKDKTIDSRKGTLLYSLSNTILANDYRKIISVSALSSDTYATLCVTGLDGVIEFTNHSDWQQKAGYSFKSGCLQLIRIPKECTRIIVETTDRSNVVEDTPISVLIAKDSTESRIENVHSSIETGVNFSILYSLNSQINAGQYQTEMRVSPLSTDKKASVKLDGFNGNIVFRNDSYFVIDRYILKNGIWKNIIIPKGCTKIYIETENQTVVSDTTTFDIKIVSGDITSVNDDTVIFYSDIKYISAGDYRYTNIRTTPLNYAVKAKATLRGFDGSIEFATLPEWGQKAIYNLVNNVETEITIPSDTEAIIVNIEPQTNVSSDTPFSLKLTYSESDYIQAGKVLYYDYDKRYVPVLENLIRTCAGGTGGGQRKNYKNLVLASVTDIHNDRSAYSIFEFISRYKKYFNDIIGLGDYVNGGLQYISGGQTRNGLTINANIEDWDSMIKIIGNHDAYNVWTNLTNTYDRLTTEKESYDAILKDGIASWGVQYTSDKCYFYKDYSDQKIRVVFIDYMHYDNTQESWFEGVLNDTLNSSNSAYGYHVIVCEHSWPKSSNSGELVMFENCSFEDYDIANVSDNICSVPDIIDSFQTHGGNFICHLCGHKHSSVTGVYENYPKQVVIIQPCSAAFDYWRDSAYPWDTDCIMQFFLYSFDTYKKFIRVYKVGANYNRNMQHQESMLIQYGDNIKLLSCY